MPPIPTAESPIPVALVGAGRWGSNYISTLQSIESARLVAVVDPSDEVRERCSKLGYPAVSELSAAVALGASAFVVATPTESHAALCREILELGGDVLVEKPMATSSRAADEIVALATRRRRIVLVGHLTLHHPAVQAMVDAARSGLIGPLSSVAMRRVSRATPHAGTGALWELAPHDVAVLLELVAGPIEVSAESSPFADACTIRARSPDGVECVVHVARGDQAERGCVVTGRSGTLRLDEAAGRLWLVRHRSEVLLADHQRVAALSLQCQHFLAVASRTVAPLAGPQKGADVVRVLSAAAESAANGSTLVQVLRSSGERAPSDEHRTAAG